MTVNIVLPPNDPDELAQWNANARDALIIDGQYDTLIHNGLEYISNIEKSLYMLRLDGERDLADVNWV